jgi:site-specific recombinase XerC
LPTFVDTGASLSEITNLKIDDVDLEQGYPKAMGEGRKIR